MILNRENCDAGSHSFEDCPDCGGELQYQTQSDAMCLTCREVFIHEIRGARHLLREFNHEDGVGEVVARAE